MDDVFRPTTSIILKNLFLALFRPHFAQARAKATERASSRTESRERVEEEDEDSAEREIERQRRSRRCEPLNVHNPLSPLTVYPCRDLTNTNYAQMQSKRKVLAAARKMKKKEIKRAFPPLTPSPQAVGERRTMAAPSLPKLAPAPSLRLLLEEGGQMPTDKRAQVEHRKDVQADAEVERRQLEMQLRTLQRRLVATPGTRHYTPGGVGGRRGTARPSYGGGGGRGGGSGGDGIGRSGAGPPSSSSIATKTQHNSTSTNNNSSSRRVSVNLDSASSVAYDTNDDVLRVAQLRAQQYAREQEAQLRKTFAKQKSASENAALEAERRHRSFHRRPAASVAPAAGHAGSAGRVSTAVIIDPLKRAAEMMRKAELAARSRQDATLRKFEAETARVEARRAKVMHKNVSRRISFELERRQLEEWDRSRLVPHKAMELQHEIMEAHYRQLRDPTRRGRASTAAEEGWTSVGLRAQNVFVEEKRRLAAIHAAKLAGGTRTGTLGRVCSYPLCSLNPTGTFTQLLCVSLSLSLHHRSNHVYMIPSVISPQYAERSRVSERNKKNHAYHFI